MDLSSLKRSEIYSVSYNFKGRLHITCGRPFLCKNKLLTKTNLKKNYLFFLSINTIKIISTKITPCAIFPKAI